MAVQYLTERVHRAGVGTTVLMVVAIALLALRQSFTVPMGLGMTPALLLALMAGSLWVLTRAVGQRSTAHVVALSCPILLFVLADLVSYGALMSRGTTPDVIAATRSSLLLDVVLLTTYFFVVTVIRSTNSVVRVAQAVVLGASISAVFAIIEYGTGIDFAAMAKPPLLRDHGTVLSATLMREGFARPQGAAGHPLELSAVLTVVSPIALGLVYGMRMSGHHWWPWATLATILVAGAGLTLSRSAVVGIVAAVLVMCWAWPVRRLVVLVCLGASVAVLAYVSNSRFLQAFVDVFAKSESDSSLQSRSIGREFVYQNFARHLWFGEGPSTYSALDHPVLDNQYLARLMETGVVGLATYVALLISAFVCALVASGRFSRARFDAPTRAMRRDAVAMLELTRGVAGAMAALIVISSILDVAGFVQIWFLTWILVALTGSTLHVSRKFVPVVEASEECPDKGQSDDARGENHLHERDDHEWPPISDNARAQS
ncbi:O-antigen ligase family protein [Rhodococcus sp. NPDC058521]|uniref:O-antigen ligase family protein n=1 Tax=Rhodococcus sp. NPDC058521 TaxID=3346536 RepID=UPI0036588272